jgi:hypothetical protein
VCYDETADTCWILFRVFKRTFTVKSNLEQPNFPLSCYLFAYLFIYFAYLGFHVLQMQYKVANRISQ